ncbi:putative acetyltransferase [Sphingobacterium spiritivorum]|nr:putative acetyltransferase [Sphingobacterium spiritivorum]
MKEDIKIDFAIIDDVESIVSLVRSSFDKSYLEISIYKCKGIASFIITELNNQYSPYKYLVAKIGDKIVGFVEFKMFPHNSTAFLNMIATDNTHKGLGIAKKIFSYSENYFREQLYSNIQLDVFQSNEVARQWYEKMGFVKEESSYFCQQHIGDASKHIQDILILNLSQFNCLYEKFGFSFLQMSAGEQSFTLGIIDENIIIREDKISEEILVAVKSFFKDYNFKMIYYKGQDKNLEKYKYIGEIHRMKLTLQ